MLDEIINDYQTISTMIICYNLLPIMLSDPSHNQTPREAARTSGGAPTVSEACSARSTGTPVPEGAMVTIFVLW